MNEERATRKRRMLDVFDEKGVLSKIVGDYKPRPGQIEMATRVHDTIEHRRILVVEGPTGTGKSFAYLVPAVLFAASKQLRVVVATANINLQRQIVKKDIPSVLEATGVGRQLMYQELKGINNYYCRLAYEENADRLSDYAEAQPHIKQQLQDILHAFSGSLKLGAGDKTDLGIEPDANLWGMLSTDSEGCIGQKCQYFESCGAMDVRKHAKDSNIVIVNYHMLFADLMAGNGIIGKYDVLVCDEAHEFSNVARDFFGLSLSMPVIARATKRCPVPIKKRVREVAQRFFDDVREEYFPNDNDGTYTLRQPLTVSYDALAEELELVRMYFRAGKREESNPDAVARDKKDEDLVTSIIGRLTRVCDLLAGGQVTYVERSGDKCALHAKPVDVSQFIYNRFLAPRVDEEGRTWRKCVIFTSATLSDGESFQLVRDELGIPLDAGEYLAPSPFDLTKQCVVFLDPTLPVPSGNERQQHLEASSERIAQAIHIARGRTLALFTSRRGMVFAANYVTRRLKEMGNKEKDLPILTQGTHSKAALIELFKEEKHVSLFGLASFWTGVDVPGESLSVLVIDKLPFPTPDDPVVNALQDMKGGGWNGFLKVAVPRAAVDFRQGYGRLIRSVGDYGVMIFLDPRIATKEYGEQFLRGLKGVPVMTDFSRLPAVIDHLDKQRVIHEGANKLERDRGELVGTFFRVERAP